MALDIGHVHYMFHFLHSASFRIHLFWRPGSSFFMGKIGQWNILVGNITFLSFDIVTVDLIDVLHITGIYSFQNFNGLMKHNGN
jgi:hypothetical protein